LDNTAAVPTTVTAANKQRKTVLRKNTGTKPVPDR